MSRPIRWLAASLLAAAVASATPARAEDIARAGAAFQQAQEAQLTGDHAHAAELYELANRIAPTAEALRSAMSQRRKIGDNSIAATHALELLRAYPADPSSREAAETVLDELRSTLVLVKVHCTRACTVTANHEAVVIIARRHHQFFLDAGAARVAALVGDQPAPAQAIDGKAGGEVELRFAPEPPARPEPVASEPEPPEPAIEIAPLRSTEPSDSGGGLSPIYFWSAVGLTAAVGGVALWSGLDTLANHDDYVDLQEQGARFAELEREFERGRRLERRTNALLVTTAVLGAGTALLGILATDWGGRGEEVTVGVGGDGERLLVTGAGRF